MELSHLNNDDNDTTPTSSINAAEYDTNQQHFASGLCVVSNLDNDDNVIPSSTVDTAELGTNKVTCVTAVDVVSNPYNENSDTPTTSTTNNVELVINNQQTCTAVVAKNMSPFKKKERHLSEAIQLKCSKKIQLEGPRAAANEAFNIMTADKGGVLSRSTLVNVLTDAAHRVNFVCEDDVIQDAVDVLLEDVGGGSYNKVDDHDRDVCISRGQFLTIFRQKADMATWFYDSLTISKVKDSVRESLSTASKDDQDAEDIENHQVYESHFISNEFKSYFWLGLYVAANVLAFAYKATKYARNDEATAVFGNCILVARGAAQAINLNAFLILLPMCRHLGTWLRGTRLRFVFPFDLALEVHILFGIVLALLATAHTAAHICDFYRFARADEEDILALFGTDSYFGSEIPDSKRERWALCLSSRAGITGIIMVVCMIVAYVAIYWRRKNFNLFWLSHHLLLVMIIALCVHGTQCLLEPFQSVYWVIIPFFFYIVPRLLRETSCSKAKVLDVRLKHGGVVNLQLQKNTIWAKKYTKSGMYGFLNVPKVSRWEWHPFTLTSCEQDEFLEFHFQRVGDWTTRVHDLLENYAKDDDKTSIIGKEDDRTYPTVKIEGPMGASSQGFNDFPVIVLIGAGIGITPMISVLRSLLNDPGDIRRVFFYWTIRDRKAFEWFSQLLDDVYDCDKKHLMQVRYFLTSVKYDDRDLGDVLLKYAARAKHMRTDVDLLLGRRTHHQVQVGRPDWREELTDVKNEAKLLGFNKCGIFFCGPKAMASAIKKRSDEISMTDKEFNMYMTKETF